MSMEYGMIEEGGGGVELSPWEVLTDREKMLVDAYFECGMKKRAAWRWGMYRSTAFTLYLVVLR
jgi:hypothetical protein